MIKRGGYTTALTPLRLGVVIAPLSFPPIHRFSYYYWRSCARRKNTAHTCRRNLIFSWRKRASDVFDLQIVNRTNLRTHRFSSPLSPPFTGFESVPTWYNLERNYVRRDNFLILDYLDSLLVSFPRLFFDQSPVKPRVDPCYTWNME